MLCFFFQDLQFLVQWKGYDKWDCTWEPYTHIPSHIRNKFANPDISIDRLKCAATNFEEAIQKRLHSRINRISIEFDGDIFRFCFGHTCSSILIQKENLQKLPLSHGWDYNINKHGRGVRLAFPIRLQFRIHYRKKFVSSENLILEKNIPKEKLVITSATEVMRC